MDYLIKNTLTLMIKHHGLEFEIFSQDKVEIAYMVGAKYDYPQLPRLIGNFTNQMSTHDDGVDEKLLP